MCRPGNIVRLALASGCKCGGTYLEEVQVAAQGCAGRLVALHRQLSDHDNDDANERRERQQHRRKNTRESSCLAHLCGCVVVLVVIESWGRMWVSKRAAGTLTKSSSGRT